VAPLSGPARRAAQARGGGRSRPRCCTRSPGARPARVVSFRVFPPAVPLGVSCGCACRLRRAAPRAQGRKECAGVGQREGEERRRLSRPAVLARGTVGRRPGGQRGGGQGGLRGVHRRVGGCGCGADGGLTEEGEPCISLRRRVGGVAGRCEFRGAARLLVVVHLLASKDEALLRGRDALLLLDALLRAEEGGARLEGTAGRPRARDEHHPTFRDTWCADRGWRRRNREGRRGGVRAAP